LLSAAYIGIGEQLEIGAAHFTANRVLITVGFLRIILKGERMAVGWNSLDWAMLLWAIWAVFSSVFHAAGTLIFRLGIALDTLGTYVLFRVFVHETRDVVALCKMVCVLLVPLGAAMLCEKLTGRNWFESLGGAAGEAELRNGHFRARGPFVHQIAAGNVGAVCMPMALFLWSEWRKLALAGLAATGGIVLASGSSGPLMTVLAVLLALALWKKRAHIRTLRWLAVFLVVLLDLVMNDPVYYLMARIDITGGSTGWHRAALIDGAIRNFGRWWLGGTDYTRDWMATGIPATSAHTDITNHYLQMGVWGGLPLLLLFMYVLFTAFVKVSKTLRTGDCMPVQDQFLTWTLGSILFGHAAAFLSIAYYDHQSVIFLYFTLGAIGSVTSAIPVEDHLARAAGQEVLQPWSETAVGHDGRFVSGSEPAC
jgi:hypothetical protein